ncbi:MAG: response regulator transcription factor [Thermoanaerobaculia bacterium]|nr:response regulator transcription factor [Thermoanaerobaculia bacterium]
MLRILIADDHAMFREALVNLLEDDSRFEVVGQAATGQEAVARHRELEPDLVILDVNMPGRGGLETIEEIKRRDPQTKILMVTMHREDDYAIRCLKAGADGYLTKDKATRALIEGIVKIAGGGKLISSDLAEKLALYLDVDAGRPLHAKLSNRELEVLRLLAVGKTVSEIADELALSVKTISTYRGRILEKMNLRNNAELMRYALQHGLVDDEFGD